MDEFQTSLLREKFTIKEKNPKDLNNVKPIIALSNRLALPMRHGEVSETLIVRAQNMHTAARMGAKIVSSFSEYGPLMNRAKSYDWDYAWLSIEKGYEKNWNPQRWLAVYHKGRVVFEAGEVPRHPFLDVIEKCDALNKDDYANSIEIAKGAFQQAGKKVDIEHDSNVALIMSIKEDEGKCGVIVRGPNKVTTFNYNAKPKGGRKVKVSQCLTVSAAFLEGVQLAFFIGMNRKRKALGLIESGTPESLKTDAASRKLGRLNGAIMQFENMLNVTYRPDRPNLPNMVIEAEEFAKGALKREIEAKIASGEINKEDWL